MLSPYRLAYLHKISGRCFDNIWVKNLNSAVIEFFFVLILRKVFSVRSNILLGRWTKIHPGSMVFNEISKTELTKEFPNLDTIETYLYFGRNSDGLSNCLYRYTRTTRFTLIERLAPFINFYIQVDVYMVLCDVFMITKFPSVY